MQEGYEVTKSTKEDLIKILVMQGPAGMVNVETGMSVREKARKKYEAYTEEDLREEIQQQIIAAEKIALKQKVLHLYLADKTSKDQASELVTQWLKRKYTFKTIKDDSTSEMWVYKKGIYEPNGETTIKEEVRGILEESYTPQKTTGIIEKIKADTYIEQETFFSTQNKHPHLLPVKNGVLNIKTLELTGFTPEKIFFNKINARYEPGSDCPKIKEFVKEITAEEHDVDIIQEFFGYTLCKDYFVEKALMLYGSNGRNGKSKLLQLLTTLLGVENTASISLQDLEEDDFATANLFGKMVNVSADISNHAMRHTGMFKKVTGRDVIQANRKFKAYFKFVNYAKMIFASNELPMVYTVSEAFWLRWVIIEFPYQFLPEKEIKSLSPKEKAKARIQDPDVIKNILSEEELNGLLLWSLEGLKRLFKNNDFSTNRTSKQVRQQWLRNSSSIRAFLEDCCKENYDNYVSKAEFQRRYSLYCRENNLKVQSGKVVHSVLTAEYGVTQSRPTMANGERANVWDGISFKESSFGKVSSNDDQLRLTPQAATVQEEMVEDGVLSIAEAVSGGHDNRDKLIVLGFSSEDIDLALTEGDIFEPRSGEFRTV